MKFIVYKGSGGLAHMIGGLSVAIELALKNNSYLIIDCSKHVAFQYNFSDWFYINDKKLNHGESYNIIPDNLLFYDLDKTKLKLLNNGVYEITKENPNNKFKFFHKNYSYYYKNINLSKYDPTKNISVFVSATRKQYNNNIKVNKDIIDKIKSNNNFINQYYISVHYRNTDIKNNLDKYIKRIKDIIKMSNIKIIYLATDDNTAYNQFKTKLADIKIIQYSKPPLISSKAKNIHYGYSDKYTIIYNCLVDMYMILNSTVFLPSYNSGLSKWLIQMINQRKNIFDIDSKTIVVKSLN